MSWQQETWDLSKTPCKAPKLTLELLLLLFIRAYFPMLAGKLHNDFYVVG